MVSTDAVSRCLATVQEIESPVESCSSSTCQDEADLGNFLVLPEGINNIPPSFGNVSVAQSNNVHFGNKTFVKIVLPPNENTNFPKLSDSDSPNSPKKFGFTNGLNNPSFASDDEKIVLKDVVEKRVPELETDIRKGIKWLPACFLKHSTIITTLVLGAILGLAIITGVLLINPPFVSRSSSSTFPYSDEGNSEIPVDAPIDPSSVHLGQKLRLNNRLSWLAQPPSEPPNKLKTPVPYVIIQHTATENCSSQAQCKFQIRNIQTYHIESRSFWDIAYNFLVGGDGEAYEGRGWTNEGSHTFNYNTKSIGIAFIGTFNTLKAPKGQLRACQLLIEMGVQMGYIHKNYTLLGARQLSTTQSPGSALFEQIQKWPHWRDVPFPGSVPPSNSSDT